MEIRKNPTVKALAFIMAVVAFATAAMMGCYQLANFDAIWNESGSISNGYTVRRLLWQDETDIRSLISYYRRLSAGEDLNTYSAQRMASLEQELSVENTNLRWQLLDQDGRLIYGNTEEALPAQSGLYWSSVQPSEAVADVGRTETYEAWGPLANQFYREDEAPAQVLCEDWTASLAADLKAWQDGDSTIDPDAVYQDLEGQTQILITETTGGTQIFAPTIRAVLETNSIGFRYDLENGWLYEPAVTQADLALWLESSLPVADKYQRACTHLSAWREHRAVRLCANVILAAAGLCLTVFLCAASAHKRGQEELGLNWFHRIPGDLLLAVMVTAVILLTALALELGSISGWPMSWQIALIGSYTCAVAALAIGFLITFTARCKTHTLLRNTLVWRFCAWCCRLVRSVVKGIPLVWKAVLVCGAYLLFSVIFVGHNGFLWTVATIVLLAYLCLWAYQWKKIRQGTREIMSGNVDYQIDTRRMLPDLKAHADELNNLGQSIAAAVDERMRSEHFKAELITNVSHDLKTPLTSIINYVDLLKKENIDNPKAAEYIEVLDRKSQRLKKLTEDLVEASKASTGVLTVTLERLDLVQLADQALAEYEDRLAQKGLSVVRTLPAEPVWVEADGRHLWRVLDNLLSNCAKYALEGTRVYVEIQRYSDCAKLSVKNISREELNIPPEQLVERFVRGDESRTQEGSGLGLSIAQSLTDLQHGQFQISIDGDLFKATVTLPLAAGPEML